MFIIFSQVAYTFDAGPNACLYLLESDVPMVLSLVQHFFPPTDNGGDYIRGISYNDVPTPSQVSDKFLVHNY